MNIRGDYSSSEAVLRKDIYYFDIGKEEGINFHIKKAPYYHNTVTIYNPVGQRVGHFSFKSQNNKFYISEGVTPGRWRVEMANTMKFGGEFDIEITQGKEDPEAIPLIHNKRDFDRIYKTDRRWYSGDFHMHTNFSDGYYPLERVVENCMEKDLEVVAITDHNVMHREVSGAPLPILPSTELTLDDKGHFNLHGLEEELDFSKIIEGEGNIPDLIEKFLKKSRGKNAVTCLNHPFAKGTALLYDIKIDDINVIEVVRSPFKGSNNTTNNMAVKAFDYIWKKGYRIYGVGGSDSHGQRNEIEETVGFPTTHLYLDGLSIGNTLEAMRKGKTYITVGTSIELEIFDDEGRGILPGEMIESVVRYEVTGDETLLWNTIVDGKIVDTIVGKDISTKFKLDTGQYGRIEARDRDGNIRVFINPNYRSGGKKTGVRWNQVMDFVLGSED